VFVNMLELPFNLEKISWSPEIDRKQSNNDATGDWAYLANNVDTFHLFWQINIAWCLHAKHKLIQNLSEKKKKNYVSFICVRTSMCHYQNQHFDTKALYLLMISFIIFHLKPNSSSGVWSSSIHFVNMYGRNGHNQFDIT
jgi:hypothetical protein